MPISHDLEAFRKNYLAVGLTNDQLKDLAGIANLKKLKSHEHLIDAGSKSADVYVILEGIVDVYLPDGDKLAELGPGAVLGEIALIDAGPRSANAICRGPVDVAQFDATALRGYLNLHRDMGFVVIINLARVLSGRLRDANSKIDMLLDQTEAWKYAL